MYITRSTILCSIRYLFRPVRIVIKRAIAFVASPFVVAYEGYYFFKKVVKVAGYFLLMGWFFPSKKEIKIFFNEDESIDWNIK